MPASRRGWKGRTWPGQVEPCGPGVDVEDLTRGDCPGGPRSRGRIRLRCCRWCTDRGRHQAAVGGEQVDVEVVERDLRQVFEVDGHLTGQRVGPDRCRRASRGCRSRRQSGRSGTGLRASVRRCRSSPSSGSASGNRVDRDRADLGVVGAVRRPSESKLASASVQARLAVGGVGVDRQPFGKGARRPSGAGRRRDREAEELRVCRARYRGRRPSRSRRSSGLA